MSRVIGHAALAAMLLLMAPWMVVDGRLAMAALDITFAVLNGCCAFGFYMTWRYR